MMHSDEQCGAWLKRAEQAEARCKELAEERADGIEALLKAEAELAALKGRRCGGCEHDGVCAAQRAGWRQFRVQSFSCCCWTERVTE